MVKEKVKAGEVVVAILKSRDGKKRVIRERWYSKYLRLLKCLKI